MNTLLKCFIAAFFLLNISTLQAQLTTGDLSVVGFDADSTDYLAIVNFREIPANTVVYIRDDEWNGTAFTTGEGTLSWTSGATAIAPGTIILLNAMADTAKMSLSTTISSYILVFSTSNCFFKDSFLTSNSFSRF